MQGSHYCHVTSLPERRITKFYFFFHHSEVVNCTMYWLICWKNTQLSGRISERKKKEAEMKYCYAISSMRLAFGTLSTSILFDKI